MLYDIDDDGTITTEPFLYIPFDSIDNKNILDDLQ